MKLANIFTQLLVLIKDAQTTVKHITNFMAHKLFSEFHGMCCFAFNITVPFPKKFILVTLGPSDMA